MGLQGVELDRALDEALRAWHVQEGILPSSGQSIPDSLLGYKKSIPLSYAQKVYYNVKNRSDIAWKIPSNGASYDLCGHIWWDEGKGCLNVKGHENGKVYIRFVSATCFRAECPVCYQKWAAREAGNIEDKFKRLSRNNAEAPVPGLSRPIHVVISVPEKDAHLLHDDFKKLRARAYKIAKRVGVKGGCAIFHPFANDKMHEETAQKILIDESTADFDLKSIKEYYDKMNKSVNFWYIRPHFHLICYGWIDEDAVKSIYEETGYIVKNLGVRDSVRNTAHYQLSHAGIKKGVQTVTWFGALSNRNYHKLDPLPKFKPRKPKCPDCGHALQPVRYDPDLPLMLQGRGSPYEGFPEGGW